MRFRIQRVLLSVLVMATLMASGPEKKANAQSDKSIKLMLFLVVDQLRYDYLERFGPLFTGGLKFLLERSSSFQEAYHDHAVTTTGPGHAVLATGVVPSRSGIIDNSWYDRRLGKTVNCVEDADSPLLGSRLPGRSPKNLLRTTLADWIKTQHPKSKVYSASKKDRGAILPAGLRPDGAFWYDDQEGRFVTSEYYAGKYPAWVNEFNDRRIPAAFFGQAWEPLPVSREVMRQTGIEKTDSGWFDSGFPKVLGGATLAPTSAFFADFGESPFMDQFQLEFARALVTHEGLGQDEDVDMLALSFSVLDLVGHSFGPNSPEVLDVLLRLDRELRGFFEFLDKEVGLDRIIISMSADHGVMTLPEYLAQHQLEGSRLKVEDVLCFQQTGEKISLRMGPGDWFVSNGYLDYEMIGRRGVLRRELEDVVASELQKCKVVERVWTRSQLESDEQGPYLDLYRKSFHPQRSPDFYVQFHKFLLSATARGTTHGSPYDYDAHVPLLVYLPGAPGRQIPVRVKTVDLAPTLAALLKINTPSDLDGVDRSSLLKTSPLSSTR